MKGIVYELLKISKAEGIPIYICDAGFADGPEPCTKCQSKECRRKRKV